MLDLAFQGMIENIDRKEQVVHISYKDMENLEFQIMLASNYYTNPNCMHICFPMKIKKATNEANNIDTDLIPVNNFFAHLIKDISITRYGNDKQLMPTFFPYEIYQYADAMLKYLPKKALKNIKKQCSIAIRLFLTINQQLTGEHITPCRLTYSTVLADISNNDLDHRIDTFQNQLKMNMSIEYLCAILQTLEN